MSSGSSIANTFVGNGVINYNGKKVGLKLDGGRNETSVSLSWETSYGNGETIKCTSRLTMVGQDYSKEGYVTKNGIDSQLTLHFSEFPHYNLAASWKYQVST